MSDFTITAVKKDRGSCSKTYTLEGGNLTSKSPGGVHQGEGQIVSFQGLKPFSDYLNDCQANEEHRKCFLAAEPVGKKEGDKFVIRSKKNAVPESISLSKEHFPAFHPGKSLLLLDYDPDQSITGEINYRGAVFYFADLAKVLPELNWNVDYIARYSSSAGIKYEDKNSNICPVKIYNGIHFYLLVNSGARIDELINTIFIRLILAGVYWVKPSKAGKAEICTLVDTQAFHPYTPLLPVSAKIIDRDGKGKISVDKKHTAIELTEGSNRVLNLDNLKPLTPEDIEQANAIIKREKTAYEASDESKKIVAEHKKAHAEHYAKQGGNKLAYKRTAHALIENQEIFGNHPIWFDDYDAPITAEVLAGPLGKQFDELALSDPLDIERAEAGKAKFYWNDGKRPQINCFKRGGEIIRVFKYENISSNEQMNRDHAILMDSNKTSITAFDGQNFQYLTIPSTKLWYGNDKAHNKDGTWIEIEVGKYANKVEHWLSSGNRNRFLGEEFKPIPGKFSFESEPFPYEDNKLNTYRGLQVKPIRGDVSLLKAHIADVVCNNVPAVATYLTFWIARMVQRPDLPAETAIMIKTPEGTGKGTLFEEIIAKWWGPYAMITTNQDHVFGRFNDASGKTVFLYLNEALFGGNKQQEGALKQAITDKNKTVEEKYKSVKNAANYQHIVITTNNDWGVSIGSSDRRFAAFEMSASKVGDKQYFKALHDWINNGGVAAALYYFLYEIDISNFNPRIIPAEADSSSKIKFDQKMRSAPNNIKFIAHILQTPDFRYKKGDRNAIKHTNTLDDTETLAGVRVNDSTGNCYIHWQPVTNGSGKVIDAKITLPKGTIHEIYIEFCKTQRGGSTDTKEVLGRFLKGGLAGSNKTQFAGESQELNAVFGSGRKWKLSFLNLRAALATELQSTEIESSVNLNDIVNTES